MSSLHRVSCLIVVLVAFGLTACGLQQMNQNPSGSENEALELDRQVMALAGGSSDHVQTEYARATVWGTGEVNGMCRTFEVLPIVYDRTTMETGGSVESHWLWVRVRMFCCEREQIFSTWAGRVNLEDADFTVNVYPNRHDLWNASVTKTVTVVNTADRTQRMDLSLDLVWSGLYDIRQRSENRWSGPDIDLTYNYQLTYEMSVVSGVIDLEGVTFDFNSQENAWIGDENRVTHQ